MGLSLLAGPANAGKVALLLERYLASLADEPVLIVPNRSDVDRVERELLRHTGALVGGATRAAAKGDRVTRRRPTSSGHAARCS